MKTYVIIKIFLSCYVFWIIGCSSLPVYTSKNEICSNNEQPCAEVPRANINFPSKPAPKNYFIGVALSGGGSRAANFSAAVLEQLEDLGFLQHVSAISSVSGGSITAAYYGLYHKKRNRLEQDNWRQQLKEKLRTDFIKLWLLKMVSPHNLLKYWFTNFDRSDLMASVLNDELYHDKTFADLNSNPYGPKILINSSDLTGGNIYKNMFQFRRDHRFSFIEQNFASIDSRLSTYPMANAVMASSAFPGVFHNVTLQNFSEQHKSFRNGKITEKIKKSSYVHLFDAGPSDNLGIWTLMEAAEKAKSAYDISGIEKSTGKFNCLIFMVDSDNVTKTDDTSSEMVFGKDSRIFESDTRGFFDFLIDQNVIDATDIMLKNQRRTTLSLLNKVSYGPVSWARFDPEKLPIWLENEYLTYPKCEIWHINFNHLPHLQGYEPLETWIGVKKIKTHYKLAGETKPKILQDQLYKAAKHLTQSDKFNQSKACKWFRKNHLHTNCPFPN
jgi:NTE family protein